MIKTEDIKKLYEIIRNLYLEDEIPWVIGYSGGKDSTATLQLVWMALRGLTEEQKKHKTIHVISTDTLVESPVVAKAVEDSLDLIRYQSEKDNMPFMAHRLLPKYNDTFWVNLIGRGYPYPRPTMRWCTDRLKIKPANHFVQEMVSAYGEVILLLGTRKAESANRAKSMEHYEKKRVRDYLSPNGSLQNEMVFSPLEDWTDDDVWFFLMQYENPWKYSNKKLLAMYRGATADGECPLVMSQDTPSCGKSRFGCWVCTMVEEDKSMAAMITNDSEKEWMLPLLQFRNDIGNSELDRERRDFRRMNGNVKLYKSRLVHGPYKKEVREEWLRKLLRIQIEINQNGPAEFSDLKLITEEELNIIRKIWLEEKHQFDDSLPQIYYEETGKKLPLTNNKKESVFGKREWNLLQDVCKEIYPDEELMMDLSSKILDVEKRFFEISKRRGIYLEIEKQLKRCFYRNEEEAAAYAGTKVRRKKEMGAFYDKKAELEDQIVLEEWDEGSGAVN